MCIIADDSFRREELNVIILNVRWNCVFERSKVTLRRAHQTALEVRRYISSRRAVFVTSISQTPVSNIVIVQPLHHQSAERIGILPIYGGRLYTWHLQTSNMSNTSMPRLSMQTALHLRDVEGGGAFCAFCANSSASFSSCLRTSM